MHKVRIFLRSVLDRFKRPMMHTPGDQKIYGEAVDRLLRELRSIAKEGVDERSRALWAEILKFLDQYQRYHQGFPDLDELFKFIGHKIENPDRMLDAPPRLHVPTSTILGPQKI
ncbi:MAG TPA: hypothetical protein VHC68_03670 [Candidatus Paceibacterota bacterium]|nr:hypothetical protein [Candidatus Paceibacterota bacterium]